MLVKWQRRLRLLQKACIACVLEAHDVRVRGAHDAVDDTPGGMAGWPPAGLLRCTCVRMGRARTISWGAARSFGRGLMAERNGRGNRHALSPPKHLQSRVTDKQRRNASQANAPTRQELLNFSAGPAPCRVTRVPHAHTAQARAAGERKREVPLTYAWPLATLKYRPPQNFLRCLGQRTHQPAAAASSVGADVRWKSNRRSSMSPRARLQTRVTRTSCSSSTEQQSARDVCTSARVNDAPCLAVAAHVVHDKRFTAGTPNAKAPDGLHLSVTDERRGASAGEASAPCARQRSARDLTGK